MNKIKRYCHRWNQWRKQTAYDKWHQFLVLIRIEKSPSLEAAILSEDMCRNFMKGFNAGLKDWPKEGYPVTEIEEIAGGIRVTIDISKK